MYIPIFKQNFTLEQEFEDFKEEVREVLEYRDTENLKEELLDVIQMSLGMLHLVCNKNGLEMKSALDKHVLKLNKKDWEIEKYLNIVPSDIKEKEIINAVTAVAYIMMDEEGIKEYSVGDILEKFKIENPQMAIEIVKDKITKRYKMILGSCDYPEERYTIFFNLEQSLWFLMKGANEIRWNQAMNSVSKFERFLFKLYVTKAKIKFEEEE